MGLLLWLASAPAHAQSTAPALDLSRHPSAEWELIVDGEAASWPEAPVAPVDSLQRVARRTVVGLQREGYYLARLDSAAVDSSAAPPAVRLYVRRGPEVPVGEVRIEGAEVFETEKLRQLMDTRRGRPLRPDELEADLEAILERYEEAGYPLAQARVAEATLTFGEKPQLDLTLAIDEGQALRVQRLELEGAERTQPDYVMRVTRLPPGTRVTSYDPAVLQRRLEETGLYRSVGTPELLLEGDSAAVVRIPLEEEPPGTFDLVLGYQPTEEGEKASGQIVGNGHLALRNLFGSGRLFGLRLDRRPGHVSEVEVHATDPYVFGLPFRVDARFEGLQQDSTYDKQQYRLELGYRWSSRLRIGLRASREVTRPGPAGARLRPTVSGLARQQRIPRADAWFGGLSLSYERLDRPDNPRKGFSIGMVLERGQRTRSERAVSARQDTILRRTTLRQERIQGSGRLYVPVFQRQVAVLGAEGSALVSDEYDLSDLFRLGGATSLRGYDEDRFRGRAVGRALAEYRYQLRRRSYAYLFFDLGYVETPALVEGEESVRGVHPGYGLGFQLGTRLGLINMSYALNPRDAGPADGRVHLGLSVGL